MRFLRALFALAIFLSSCLLFLAEPMVGKRLVPLFGGSAAVWTTCLVFFQSALLLGYCFAHWLSTRLSTRKQGFVYLVLLAVGLLFSLNANPHLHPNISHPTPSVFWLLSALIGIPFVTLSASSPLLQAWYARSHASESGLRPPYRLFALSNFGSLAALASYPAFVEPHFTLHTQAVVWGAGFFLYCLLCVAIVWRIRNPMLAVSREDARNDASRLDRGRMLLWLLLAACGSVLLCAVTNYLSQNIAAIPLLWVAPLTMYLLSFILAFQGGWFYPRVVVLILLAGALGAWSYILWTNDINLHLNVAIPLFCGALLVSCLFCHGELHRLRPEARHTTAFYLTIASGGALGAFFVGILSPMIFRGDYEFCCALIFTAALALVVTWKQPVPWRAVAWRSLWLVATLAMPAVFFMYASNYGQDSIAKMRNFYGLLRVTATQDKDGSKVRTLYNGTIEHGTQWQDDDDRTIPTTYYAEDSGVGLALNLCCEERPRRVGLIGLGAGTLAAYGRKGDVFRFYEINPLVERVARGYFTYLADSDAAIEIVPGDARVSLENEALQHYDVLAVDAFSGDAIPVHLLTAQALALYLRHLQPDGIIAFHVSNQYLNLEQVVGQQADHAGLHARWIASADDSSRGEYAADWIVVTRNEKFLALPDLQTDARDIEPIPALRLWTDDYNSLLPLLRWRVPPPTEDQ
jgi:spermidine synthase